MASIPGTAGPGAKFPQWAYNTQSRVIDVVADPAEKAAAEAVTWPWKLIFFTSESAADSYAKSQGGGIDITKTPVSKVAAGGASAATAVASTAGELGKIGAVADAAYKELTKASMWRSLGWIALGGVLTSLGIYWYAIAEGKRGLLSIAQGKKPSISAPVLPLSLMVIGIYLDWFGVKYWEDTKTIWPSDPIKSVLTNGTLPARTEDTSASGILSASETAAVNDAAYSGSSGSASVPSTATGSVQDQARQLLAKYHWAATELIPLVSLWNRESNWNPKARNTSSGAYGIAQALGHGVPGGAAPDGTNEYGGYGLTTSQAKAANSGVAYWQIVWGLNYIEQAYGSPSAAWAHETSDGWY